MENIACTPNEGCRYYPDCYEDTHHLYWPRRRYTSSVERQFRQLPENQAELCRNVHSELHATEQPPKKPSRAAMLAVIGEALCRE